MGLSEGRSDTSTSRSRHVPMRRLHIPIAFFFLAAATVPAEAQQQQRPQPRQGAAQGQGAGLNVVPREGGVSERYYAVGDPYLETGLRLSERYWDRVSGSSRTLVRGGLDRFLPTVFQRMEHR